MNLRGLLAAIVVLAALGGGVYWSQKNQKEKEGKPAADTVAKLLTVPEDQFQAIRIVKAGGEVTKLEKGADGAWKITEPKPLPADQEAVSSLVSSLASVASDRLIEEKTADWAPFGLAAPQIEVTISRKDGKTSKLLLGDDTPTGGGLFARSEGDPRVVTVATFIKTSVDKSSKDLRDRRLLTFNQEKLTRVELQTKGKTIEFGKNSQNEWQVLKPGPLRADGLQVDELVRKLKEAKMDTSVTDDDAKKAVASFGSAARVAVATVSDASGNQQIEVRKDKDKNYFAKSSVVEGIFKVTADLGDGLDKDLDSFRNKKIFDFGFSDPAKLEVKLGAKPGVYEKSADKWKSGGKEIDSASIQAVVDKLRDLTSIRFLDKAAGAPELELTVTSQDGKRIEKVTLLKQAPAFFARREGEPAIYELDGKAVEDLQKLLGDVKEAQPPKADAKKK